ncbi:MAG: hypothetical protein RR060_03745, partial [Victivallaceae bacterium]
IGITQGAFYRNYAGKRDIFEKILRRMEEFDRQYAEHCQLPTVGCTENPKSYRQINHSELVHFTLEMFRYWTENDFASSFRKMLTLEQYRTPEMGALYQQYFGSGVLNYLTDLFRENGSADPEAEALRFYAPFYLLLNQYDATDNKSESLRRLERSLL